MNQIHSRKLGLEIGDDEVQTNNALRDDVPPWLQATLWGWIFNHLTGTTVGAGSRIFRVQLARKCERVLRVKIQDQGEWHINRGYAALQNTFTTSTLTWRLVDFLLAETGRSSPANNLKGALLEAGSAWQVGERNGKVGLVRRLPEGVKAAAEAAFQKPNAGNRLAAAWEEAFGATPIPQTLTRLPSRQSRTRRFPWCPPGRPSRRSVMSSV